MAAHLMSLELYVEPYRYVVSPESFALWQGIAQRLCQARQALRLTLGEGEADEN